MIEILPYLNLENCPWRFRNRPSPELAFSVLLVHLSWPLRGIELESFFGRSISWISAVFNDTIIYLYEQFQHTIEWHPLLTKQRIELYAKEFERETGISKIWGFIDGTFREVCRPSSGQEFFYSRYKKRHRFKFQSITTPNSLIISAFGPALGKDHNY